MGALRITQRIIVDRALNNLRDQQQAILQLQEELATGLRVNDPSDNPIDTRRAINTRTTITVTEQYIDNISRTNAFLTETDTAIQSSGESIRRVRELTLQGASGTYGPDQLENISEEINEILEGMVNTANHLTAGRYIFGGSRTTEPPYDVTRNVDGDITAVTYVGNSEYIETAIGNGVRVNVNEPGDAVFTSDQDLFQTLIDIRDNLLSGDQTSLQTTRLEELDTIADQLNQSLARVGAIENRTTRTSVELEDFVLQFEELLSDAVDADYAETIINLNAQNNAFQAALSAAGSVIQPSLLDFIR
ncbi:MAG: flagellar hook-associated protein 3 [bacterium]|nr:flagellar hook-associated protein 3 [bacterium]